MRALILSVIAVPLAVAALPALAQNPSADAIIQSLKPSGNLTQSLRGIKMANPSAAAPASAPAPAARPKPTVAATTASTATPPPAQTQPNASADAGPSVSLTIEFASGSDELTPQARQTLDQLGRALTSADLAQFRFRIEGHTDTVGSASYNKSLSQRRADAVAAYLEKQFGVVSARLETIGMGQEGLAVPTPPQTANPQNRRVKVVNLGS